MWIVFAHGDSDGVASAALAKALLEGQNYKVSVVFTHPVGLLGDLEEFAGGNGNLLIVDIALNELHKDDILSLLRRFSRERIVVYIDHHPLPEDIEIVDNVVWIHNTCCSASELTFRYLEGLGLDPEYSRVALYGAIGDYLDETSWVRKELNQWDKRAVYLEAGILIQGLEGSRRDHEFKRTVVEHLAKNKLPSTMNELVERSLKQAVEDENLRLWVKQNTVKVDSIAYVMNPPGSTGRAANYAKIYGGARVGLAIEEKRDTYVVSLRGETGVDLNKILRDLSKKLGIYGGGHPMAAGARIRKELLGIFLGELNRSITAQQSGQVNQ